MIYLNRKNIENIKALKKIYGVRMAQTNSRRNGNYGLVRIYARAEDRGRPKYAKIVLETEKDLRNFVAIEVAMTKPLEMEPIFVEGEKQIF